ncbi:CGCGG family rSAM-modified RiPP protein [Halomontanus rarus]|uniref:CGCGG family putative rSAM-modified RiPP protein n=1 Tax=Halomontanus rarus TaxID=3034020 RepID=UPI0023E7DE82|nr:CGCGG family rSAM-modified RiPP protein [Halovivax sp. TS33]
MTADTSDVEPVTRRVHETSWSANLEQPQHADDRELVIAEALEAVEATADGYHVNLVTHADHGHPETYLYGELDERFDHEYEHVDQCGCGGHVVRVHVE